MDADRFARYEENFLNCSRIISRCMMQLEKANGNVDTVISASVEVEGELSEAEGYLRAMDVEFRTMSSAEKRSAQQKVTDYREEFRNLTSSFQTAKYQAEAAALKGGSAARSKLLASNQRMDQSTAALQQSRILVGQTEDIGDTIIGDMNRQKEHLTDARDKVKETKEFTVDAKSILRSMGHRAIIHKICVIFTIFILLGAIISVGYYGIIKKGKK